MRTVKFAHESEAAKARAERKKREEARERAREQARARQRAYEEQQRRYWEQSRQRHSYTPRGGAMLAEDREMALEVINAGYRALSRKHHPDTGGTHDKMVVVNRVCDQLRLLIASR